MRRAALVVLYLGVLLTACAGLSVASGALAKSASNGGTATSQQPAAQAPAAQAKGGTGGKGAKGGGSAQTGTTTAPGQAGTGNAQGKGASPGTSNAFDFLQDPQCKNSQGLKGDAATNCRATGTVTGRVPVTHMGIDVNIDTTTDVLVASVPDPVRGFQSAMSSFANQLWIVFAAVLKGLLSVVSWAFDLNPFDDKILPKLDQELQNFYQVFTNPLFELAFVGVGAVLLWKGLAQRKGAEAVGQALMVIVLMLLGLWVINQPKETVGRVSSFGNDVAMLAIAGPLDGSASNPPASYSDAMSRFWEQLSTPAFARLDFDDPDWATSAKPPKGAVEAAYREACTDQSLLDSQEFARHFNNQLQAHSAQIVAQTGVSAVTGGSAASDPIKNACAAAAMKVLPKPETVAQLYTNFSPGSDARNALWDYFKDNPAYKNKVSIQGPSGWLIRLPLALLIILGLLGALLMIAWVGIRLFMQAAIALVLTAAMPLAIFMPIFGEAGRNSFRAYATTLIGALLAKIIYAAILAVCLIGAGLIGLIGWSSMISLVLQAAFWWAIFLKRSELVAFVSPHRDGGETASAIRGFSGIYAATRLGGLAAGMVSTPHRAARSGLDRHDARSHDKDAAASSLAHEDLDRSAMAYGEARYAHAQGTLAQDRQLSSRLEGARTPDARQQLLQQREAQAGEVARAQEFVSRADRREAETGTRFGPEEVRSMRQDLALQREHGGMEQHAWRVGKESAEQLSGKDHEVIAAQIAGERRAEQVVDGGGRMARWRYHAGAEGQRNPLSADRRAARLRAAMGRRDEQRAHRVTKGRDRRTVVRGF